MVPIWWPCASTASIRQEQTRRPSTVMLQAPQSPDAQPSLEPVSPSGPRSASSMVSFGSHRNSSGSPLMVVETNVLAMISTSSRALGGDSGGTLEQHAGDFGAVNNGAALVVDRTAGSGAGGRRRVQRLVVKLRADQRFRSVFDQQHGRRHRAEPDTRGGADAVLERQVDAATDHGDVHLAAWDHAQVSVARALRPRRQREADDDLARREVETARTRRHFLDRQLAASVWALNGHNRSGRDHRRHAVTSGRAVAEVSASGGATLHLLRADQVDRFEHARPQLAEPRMFGELHAG